MKLANDPLSTTFAALADPTRRAILDRLGEGGEATVTELAEPFDLSLPGVSKHLKVLERAGLIERGRQAQWRPCRLKAQKLKEATGWLERYRRFWEQRSDRLDEQLKTLQHPAAAASPHTAPQLAGESARRRRGHGRGDGWPGGLRVGDAAEG